MKQFLRKRFPLLIELKNRVYNYLAHYRFKGKDASQVFRTIYNENHWRDDESISGTGSNKRNSAEVVLILNSVLQELKITSMLDIPCGDFNWMQNVQLGSVAYLGADIVPELIDKNSRLFALPKRQFKVLNLINSDLPKVDIIFCRDCLVHLAYGDIAAAIKNIKRSGSTYLLTTTFPQHQNHNIITGDWRPVNLQRQPFSFGPPIKIYSENFSEDERFGDKSLALWKISDLP